MTLDILKQARDDREPITLGTTTGTIQGVIEHIQINGSAVRVKLDTTIGWVYPTR